MDQTKPPTAKVPGERKIFPSEFKKDAVAALKITTNVSLLADQLTACAVIEEDDGTTRVEQRQFGAFKRDRRALAEWSAALLPEVVVMESTGTYWKSPYAALEAVDIHAPSSMPAMSRTYPDARPTSVMPSGWRPWRGPDCWAMAPTGTALLAMTALQNGLDVQRPSAHLICHTDQGSAYTATLYRELLANNKMLPSMSRKGNCHDNAVAEPVTNFVCQIASQQHRRVGSSRHQAGDRPILNSNRSGPPAPLSPASN